MQVLHAAQGGRFRFGVVRPAPARAGGVRVGLGGVVRLLAAVLLLGSVLLLVALVGQATAAAQQLTPAGAGTLDGEGTGPPAGDATTRLVWAQRRFNAAQASRPDAAAADDDTAGPGAAGGSGSSPAPVLPAPPWGQVPLPGSRLQVAAAPERGERDRRGDPTPPPETIMLAAATAQPLARPQPTAPARDVPVEASAIRTGAIRTLGTAYKLANMTGDLAALIPDSNLAFTLLEPIRRQATQAEFQATTINREAAQSALIGAATGLGKLAAWSDQAAGKLFEDADTLARQADWNRVPSSWRDQLRVAQSQPPMTSEASDRRLALEVGVAVEEINRHTRRLAGPLAPDLDQKLAAVDAALGITGLTYLGREIAAIALMAKLAPKERHAALERGMDGIDALAAYAHDVAVTLRDKHALPLRQRSIDAWNAAADLRQRLGDPGAPAQLQPAPEALMGRKPVVPQHQETPSEGTQGSLPLPESPQAATRLADADSEPATPPDQDNDAGVDVGVAPDTWDAGLAQTPLEQTASMTPGTEHGTSTGATPPPSSPVSSPLRNDILVTADVSDQTGVGEPGPDAATADTGVTSLDANVDPGYLDASESLSA